MKPWLSLLMLGILSSLGAQPVTLVSTVADRPVFMVATPQGTVTRFVAPGERVRLDAFRFSGLGEKNVQLRAGATYYLARLGATEGLYELTAGQVLVVNQATRPLTVSVAGQTAVLAAGSFVLAAVATDSTLPLTWNDGDEQGSFDLARGGVYRWQLGSPEGVGIRVVLSPWD